MEKGDCKLGMYVIVGGERSGMALFKIIAINDRTAKCESMENNGHYKVGDKRFFYYTDIHRRAVKREVIAGQYIKDKLQPTLLETKNPKEVLPRHLDSVESAIMNAIVEIYNQLCPHRLGELKNKGQINQRRGFLNRKLYYLQESLGRPISKEAALEWSQRKVAQSVDR